MSSRSPTRSERRPLRAAALLLALIAVQCQAPAAAAAPVPLPVAAVFVGGAQTCLVVDLSAGNRSGRQSVSVTRDGAPQPAQLVPVVSDGLAVALVVDSSAAGAATLPAWLSAGARFILEAPASTQAVVITDSAPAAAITGPQRGPTGVVRALTSVRARGDRDTGAALRLAMRQFPAVAAGRRVVVLYTTGADAGGESAGTLGARFRASGTILVVVGTAGDAYWADAANATGGFFAPAGNPVVIPALDQVETTLKGRYLVRFPTPPALPARVSVRVGTGDLTLTGDALVARTPMPATPSARGGPGPRTAVLLGLAAAGLAALVIAIVLLLRRRRSPPPLPPPGEPPTDPLGQQVALPPPVVARGRASVPGALVPGTEVPGTEVPGSDMPGSDMPGSDMPGSGMPGSDMPRSDMPRSDMPSAAARGRAVVPGSRRKFSRTPWQ
jgi:hypothetical protein